MPSEPPRLKWGDGMARTPILLRLDPELLERATIFGDRQGLT